MIFTYLETPREYDAGSIQIGHAVFPHLVIPPNTANYTISAFCSAYSTKMVRIYTEENRIVKIINVWVSIFARI